MLFPTKDEKEVQRNFIDMVKRLSEEDDVSLVVGSTMIKLGPPCKFVFTDKSDKITLYFLFIFCWEKHLLLLSFLIF